MEVLIPAKIKDIVEHRQKRYAKLNMPEVFIRYGLALEQFQVKDNMNLHKPILHLYDLNKQVETGGETRKRDVMLDEFKRLYDLPTRQDDPENWEKEIAKMYIEMMTDALEALRTAIFKFTTPKIETNLKITITAELEQSLDVRANISKGTIKSEATYMLIHGAKFDQIIRRCFKIMIDESPQNVPDVQRLGIEYPNHLIPIFAIFYHINNKISPEIDLYGHLVKAYEKTIAEKTQHDRQ